jgi:hypothetical protein
MGQICVSLRRACFEFCAKFCLLITRSKFYAKNCLEVQHRFDRGFELINRGQYRFDVIPCNSCNCLNETLADGLKGLENAKMLPRFASSAKPFEILSVVFSIQQNCSSRCSKHGCLHCAFRKQTDARLTAGESMTFLTAGFTFRPV